MAAYFILSLQEAKRNQNSPTITNSGSVVNLFLNELKPCAISAKKIEQMKQKVRTHRAAFDFDQSFCSVAAVEFEEKIVSQNLKTGKVL
jgi:hypothetical protein